MLDTTDSLFLYSFNSTVILSTWARSLLFSWVVDWDAFSSSSTLISRSLTCFSLRSRKARWAALFWALRFYLAAVSNRILYTTCSSAENEGMCFIDLPK